MARLFLFAIGGTGARVVKAFTMLLAAGAKLPGGVSTVIPIIMDPHTGGYDLRRTQTLLNTYRELRNELGKPDNTPPQGGFFGTDLSTLHDVQANVPDNFLFQLSDAGNQTFRDYLGFSRLDKADQALVELLYSKSSLDTEMDIGFVGNPNTGSVVLNQFEESGEFEAFKATFQSSDRVFIVSSIFGGTGAAGFPTILKNIRKPSDNQFLQEAVVGALSIQPYFQAPQSNEQSDAGGAQIDDAAFVAKTKAALYYYEKSVNDKLNALYYLADEVQNVYEYDPGKGGQPNPAHVLELIGALSVLDFLSEAGGMKCQRTGGEAVPVNPIFREFSLRSANDAQLTFAHFQDDVLRQMARALTRMQLLNLYVGQRIKADDALSQGKQLPWLEVAPRLDENFKNSNFYKYLTDFLAQFTEWLDEMAGRKVAGRSRDGNTTAQFHRFAPFNTDANLARLVADFEPAQEKGVLGFGKKEVRKTLRDDLDHALSEISKGKTYASPERKFAQLFNEATEKFIADTFRSLPPQG